MTRLHVHSSPEFELEPGKSTFGFHLDQPGTVVEEHVSEALVLKILVG